jgi:hypothetical protein
VSQFRLVETFLEDYYTFTGLPDVEVRGMVLDLVKAINQAPLNQRERIILHMLYFNGPQAPERDRIDKNGETRGRPPGGNTTITIAQRLGMDFRRVNEVKQSAINKIAMQLGDGYGAT